MPGTDDDDDDDANRATMTLSPLIDDVRILREAAERQGSAQQTRRSYARAVFALIEALVELMVDATLIVIEDKPAFRLESAALRNQILELDDNGTFKARTRLHSFTARLRLLLDVVDRTAGFVVPLNFAGAGWKALRDSLNLRHELTHPKLGRPMDVTADEVGELSAAHDWIMSIFRNRKPFDESSGA